MSHLAPGGLDRHYLRLAELSAMPGLARPQQLPMHQDLLINGGHNDVL
jgi:hypothetical protein